MDCINEVHHDTTKITPMELHFGMKPTRIWQEWLEVRCNQEEEPNAGEQARRLELAEERIRRKGHRRAEKSDASDKLTSFVEGELVLEKH